MSSSLEQINDGCSLKNAYLYINDVEIETNLLTDLNILWDGTFSVYGDVMINDIKDIINSTELEPGNSISIGFDDAWGDTFLREFVILKSTEAKEQDFKGIRLKFRDIVSHTLDKTYIAKGYTDVKLSTIFTDFMALEVDAIINGFPLESKIQESTFIHEQFVVPLNMSFLEFIVAECAKEGIYIYQTKTKIYFGDFEEESHEYDYVQASTTEMYGFRIIDYSLTYNNIMKTQAIPKQNYKVFDKDTKNVVQYDKSLADYKDTMSLSEFVYDSQLTSGVKHYTKEYLLDDSEYRHIGMKLNTYLKIVVPGNITYSELFRKMNIMLTGSSLVTVARNEGDIKLSGMYECFRIEDKIISGSKFVQNLHLRRVSEGRIT